MTDAAATRLDPKEEATSKMSYKKKLHCIFKKLYINFIYMKHRISYFIIILNYRCSLSANSAIRIQMHAYIHNPMSYNTRGAVEVY